MISGLLRMLVMASLLGLAAASSSHAGQGQGTLLAVDLAANTVTVEAGTFSLSSATKIRNPQDVQLARELVEDRVGDPVSYVTRHGVPHPILRVLVLEDPEPEY